MVEGTPEERIVPFIVTPIADDLHAAHAALLRLAPGFKTGRDEGDPVHHYAEDLECLVDRALHTAAARIGPTFRWLAPEPEPGSAWEAGVVLTLDFDTGEYDNPPGLSSLVDEAWDGSALDRVALAYKRDAGWDFLPGNQGIWILAMRPYGITGGEWAGAVSGFVVLEDQDQDGKYETLAHIWTAQDWRNRGIASGLVHEVTEYFPVRRVDGVSKDGRRLLQRVAPDLLQ